MLLYPLTLTLSPTLRAVERELIFFVSRYFTHWVIDFLKKNPDYLDPIRHLGISNLFW
jgi:hypothetical protein